MVDNPTFLIDNDRPKRGPLIPGAVIFPVALFPSARPGPGPNRHNF